MERQSQLQKILQFAMQAINANRLQQNDFAVIEMFLYFFFANIIHVIRETRICFIPI